MWIRALAMKTRTAETRIGSQSEARAVIGASFQEQREPSLAWHESYSRNSSTTVLRKVYFLQMSERRAYHLSLKPRRNWNQILYWGTFESGTVNAIQWCLTPSIDSCTGSSDWTSFGASTVARGQSTKASRSLAFS